MPLALFRLDASASVGGGHAARCLSLARALRLAGWQCAFFTSPQSERFFPPLEEFDVHADPAWSPRAMRDRASAYGACNLIVVDHYGLAAAWERELREWSHSVMVIDDLADRPHDCSHLLNQTYGFDPGAYAGLVPPACRLLVGSRFALLRPAFAQCRDRSLERRDRASGVDKIVIALGATDPANATSVALKGLAAVDGPVEIDVLLGWGAPHLDEVRGLAAQGPHVVNLHIGLEEPAPLLAAADLAIGAPGVSSWERCSLGLPTLSVLTASNQEAVSGALTAAGAHVPLGSIAGLSAAAVAVAVDKLRRSPGRLHAMSLAARKISDGQGVARVLLTLLTEPAGAGAVSLREAIPSDCRALFQWQTEPRARRFARNPAPPAWSEHEPWFNGVLNDPARTLLIIQFEGSDVGTLRLDAMTGGGAEVSLLIAETGRGKGVGKAALRLAGRIWPALDLHAEIRDENEASRRAFTAAGFAANGHERYLRARIG